MDAIRFRFHCFLATLVGFASRPFPGALGLASVAALTVLLSPVMAFAKSSEQVTAIARREVELKPGFAQMWSSKTFYGHMAAACREFDQHGWKQYWIADYQARMANIEALKSGIEKMARNGGDSVEWRKLEVARDREVAALDFQPKPLDAGIMGCPSTDVVPKATYDEVAADIVSAQGDVAVLSSLATSQGNRIAALAKEIAGLEEGAKKLGLPVEPPPVIEVASVDEGLSAGFADACKAFEREVRMLGRRFVKRETATACLNKGQALTGELKNRTGVQERVISDLLRHKDTLAKAIADATPKAAPPPPVEEKGSPKGNSVPKVPGKVAPKAPPVFTAPPSFDSGDYVAVACPGGHRSDGRICVRIPDGGTLDGLRKAFGAAYDTSAASLVSNNPSTTIASFWSGGKMEAIDEGRKHGGDADTGFVARYAGRKDGYLYASLSPRTVVTLFPKGVAPVPAKPNPPVAAAQVPAVPDAVKDMPPVDAPEKGVATSAPVGSAAPVAAAGSESAPASSGVVPVASAAPVASMAAPTVSVSDSERGLPPWAQALGTIALFAGAIALTAIVVTKMHERRMGVIESDVRVATGLSLSEIRDDAAKLREKHDLEQVGRPSVGPHFSNADEGVDFGELDKSLGDRHSASGFAPVATNAASGSASTAAAGAASDGRRGVLNGLNGGHGSAVEVDSALGQPPAPGILSVEPHIPPPNAASNGRVAFGPPDPASALEESPPSTQGSPSQQLAAAAAVISSAPTEQMPQASAPVAPPVAEPPGAVASGPPSSANGKLPSSGRKRRGRRPGHGLAPTGNGNGGPQTV